MHTETIRVKGRDIPVSAANGVARFTFQQLCEQPHGAEDFLTIARKYHTVFVEGIPRMGYDRNNEANDDVGRRALRCTGARVFYGRNSAGKNIP